MVCHYMKWIESENLNKSHWDNLVLQNKGFIFNFSWYLDALADNWGVLFVNKNLSKGIAIPYTQKLNQKIVSPPYFFRASNWIGHFSENEKTAVFNFIQAQFNGDFFIHEDKNETSQLFYQTIEPKQHFEKDYHKLANRMLKKANANNVTYGDHFNKHFFINLSKQELGKKVAMWHTNAVNNFSNLIDALIQQNCFNYIEIKHNNQPAGGLIIMPTKERHIYLKGVCTPEVKKLGGMYGAMDKAINFAMQNNADFDFGGSRINGVAKFNRNLGGIDQFYEQIEWNKHPFWFNGLKKIRNRWKEKKK